MPKHKKRPEADKTLRAFYEACGLSPNIVEAAIRLRYEEPTNCVAKEKGIAAARITRARRRIHSAQDANAYMRRTNRS